MTSMPSYPSGPEPMGGYQAPQRMAPPPEVQMATRLWFASILIALVGGILNFVLTDQAAAVQKVLDSGSTGLTHDQAQTAVTLGLAIALGGALIILGLELLFVFKMRAGRNWARIVLTVLAALSLLGILSSFAQGFSVGAIINIVSELVIIAALYYMFRPAANGYFHQLPA